MVKRDANRCLEESYYKDDFLNRMKKLDYKCVMIKDKELQKQNDLERSKKKIRKYLG